MPHANNDDVATDDYDAKDADTNDAEAAAKNDNERELMKENKRQYKGYVYVPVKKFELEFDL